MKNLHKKGIDLLLKIVLNHFFTPIFKKIGFRLKPIRPKGSTAYLKDKYRDKALVGAEIGVWKGENALSLLKTLNIRKLYLIDSWCDYDKYKTLRGAEYKREAKSNHGDYGYKQTLKRLKPYIDKIEIIRMKSEEAINHINEELDFVYIDGNHSYEYVKKDLDLYWQKIKLGGVMLGDDFNIKDIAKAVFEFTEKRGIDFQTYYAGGDEDDDYIIPNTTK